MNIIKHATIYFFSLLIACTPLKKPVETPFTPNQEKKLTTESLKTKVGTTNPDNISSWELSGAIAARNKQKSWTAAINWMQEGRNQYQIRLSGPLGGGSVIVEKRGEQITYRDGNKKTTATNADALLLKQTGVRLPVNNLYYWVRGLPAPGAIGRKQYNAEQQLTQLNQAGYTISYSQYSSINGVLLPTKIRLEGRGVLIKLVIKHWKI